MRQAGSFEDTRGNTTYFGVGGSGGDGVFMSGGVVIRYTVDLAASVTPGGTYNTVFWLGGGDVNDWAVINCFLTAYDTAWASGTMYMNLGDGGIPPYDDLIDNVPFNSGFTVTRPHSPNYNSPSYFGSARKHFGSADYHTAWPVTIGGSVNYAINSLLGVSIDASGVTGPITDGFVQATVLLLPF